MADRKDFENCLEQLQKVFEDGDTDEGRTEFLQTAIRSYVSDLEHERDELKARITKYVEKNAELIMERDEAIAKLNHESVRSDMRAKERDKAEDKLAALKAKVEGSPKRWIVSWDGYESDGSGPSRMYFDREDAESVAVQEIGTASQIYCVRVEDE